jgi:hypothetical protein
VSPEGVDTVVEDCKHGLPEDQCHSCRHSQRVHTTAGGSHYHWFPDCGALQRGQYEAHQRGDHLHELNATTESAAVAAGRALCRSCRRRKGARG